MKDDGTRLVDMQQPEWLKLLFQRCFRISEGVFDDTDCKMSGAFVLDTSYMVCCGFYRPGNGVVSPVFPDIGRCFWGCGSQQSMTKAMDRRNCLFFVRFSLFCFFVYLLCCFFVYLLGVSFFVIVFVSLSFLIFITCVKILWYYPHFVDCSYELIKHIAIQYNRVQLNLKSADVQNLVHS